MQQLLWGIGVGLAAALAIKLAFARLSRLYRWFFAFLCFQVLQFLVMLPLSPGKSSYAWMFLITQPFIWFFDILVVLEIYSLALRKHPGIASMSRWVLTAAFLVAVAIAALTLSVDLSHPVGRFPVLVYYSVVMRGLLSSLVLFLLLITAFLVWSPVAVPRNIVVHAAVTSLYFLCSAALLFVRNVFGYEMTRLISTILLSVEVVCFALWIVFLTKRGEEAVVVVRSKWQAGDEQELVRQLDAINDMLLGPSRK